MRNVTVQNLPAGASLSLDIDPPMEPGERTFLVALGGNEDIVVREVDASLVTISNFTEMPAFFTFGITNLPIINMNSLPGGLAALAQTGLNAVLQKVFKP